VEPIFQLWNSIQTQHRWHRLYQSLLFRDWQWRTQPARTASLGQPLYGTTAITPAVAAVEPYSSSARMAQAHVIANAGRRAAASRPCWSETRFMAHVGGRQSRRGNVVQGRYNGTGFATLTRSLQHEPSVPADNLYANSDGATPLELCVSGGVLYGTTRLADLRRGKFSGSTRTALASPTFTLQTVWMMKSPAGMALRQHAVWDHVGIRAFGTEVGARKHQYSDQPTDGFTNLYDFSPWPLARTVIVLFHCPACSGWRHTVWDFISTCR